MSIAREVYEKTKVGEVGGMQAGGTSHFELEAFQIVVSDFDSLESEGLIDIQTKHYESQSGKHYVDLVRFKRLK